MNNVKCVILGDGSVGKTFLLLKYSNRETPFVYTPTVFDNYHVHLEVNNTIYALELWDTAGQSDYERLRPLSYPNTDIFLICFSISNRISFENVKSTWVPEIRHHCPLSKFALVGTKSDLRNDLKQQVVSTDEGIRLAKDIDAVFYHECSAVTMEGVEQLFNKAVRIVINNNNKSKRRRCNIL